MYYSNLYKNTFFDFFTGKVLKQMIFLLLHKLLRICCHRCGTMNRAWQQAVIRITKAGYKNCIYFSCLKYVAFACVMKTVNSYLAFLNAMYSHYLRYILTLFFAFICFNLNAQSITDYHTHIQDSALMKCLWKLSVLWQEPATVKDSVILNAYSVITQMDDANINNAVLLSGAYMFGAQGLNMSDEYEQVKNENDWVLQQASLYPQRLKAYLSVNPLKDYALTEIKRCAVTKKFAGLKLHFTNSDVDLRNADHIKKLATVFKLADSLALPITVHMRTLNNDYGAIDANIFINKLLVHTKHIKVQVAHMAGWGGYDVATDAALQVFINAFNKGTISRENIFFDISAVIPQPGESWTLTVGNDSTQNKAAFNAKVALIKKINAIGTSNILFGSDWPVIDIKSYIEDLSRNLGDDITARILKN